MAILAANRSLLISREIPSRCHLLCSWAKKNYNSSGPVRYVPGSYNQSKKTKKEPTLKDLEKKEFNFTDNRRLIMERKSREERGFVDHELPNTSFNHGFMETSRMLEQDDELSELYDDIGPDVDLLNADMEESELLVDEAKNDHEIMVTENDKAACTRIRQDAENMAIELLAGRAFTAVELRKKLHGKKYPLEIVDSVIADMKSRGLLNDGLYAEAFSRSRWLSSSWGPRRIKQALIQKGVSETEVAKATKQVFEDDDPDSEETAQHGMSKLAMDRLLLHASKQWLRGKDASIENRKTRIVRWLQYRGFNWGVTSFILKKLQSL